MSAILLIEDDTSVQQAISRPLERAGHRVIILAEPLSALDLLECSNIHFDLIIADVASFRYAHHQHALDLLYHRASAVDSQVLACTTRGDLRFSDRYSNLPNPLLTTRFLRLVSALVAPDLPPTDLPTESIYLSTLWMYNCRVGPSRGQCFRKPHLQPYTPSLEEEEVQMTAFALSATPAEQWYRPSLALLPGSKMADEEIPDEELDDEELDDEELDDEDLDDEELDDEDLDDEDDEDFDMDDDDDDDLDNLDDEDDEDYEELDDEDEDVAAELH